MTLYLPIVKKILFLNTSWGTHDHNIPNSQQADLAREESERFCGGKPTRRGAFLTPKTLESRSIPSPNLRLK